MTKYVSRLKKICLHPETIGKVAPSFTIVYTPLHGVGNELLQRTLRDVGFSQVYTVPEQKQPDPNFTTVKSPNPEEQEAFQMAISLGKSLKVDIIIATDPDCDRVGVAERNQEGEYEFLTGTQIGTLLLYYLLSEKAKQGTLPNHGVIVKTIVTSQMGRAIANNYGVEMIETLTGFKYIAEQIRLLEESREKRSFLVTRKVVVI
jgi:phosphoglucomutase